MFAVIWYVSHSFICSWPAGIWGRTR